MSDFQEGETIDFTRLLEEIDKIEDLDALDDIENMLLLENQKKEEAINRISHQNAEMKDELNASKCLVQELDELHKAELQTMDDLREKIHLKQLEELQEQDQQVDNLDQFELEVAEIAKKFVSAPEEYESSILNKKIVSLKNILDDHKGLLQKQLEKEAKAEEEFEKPIEIVSMDLALEIFDNAIAENISSNNNLAKSLRKISKEIDQVHFNKMTKNITNQLYKN